MQTFTPEDLLLYIYNETSPEQTANIKAALESDWVLRETFDTLITGQKLLDKVELSPRDEVIKRIMDQAEIAVNQEQSH